MDRSKSDQIGMLATVMNALYMAEVCRSNGLDAVVQTPFQIGNITELFSKDSAIRHMKINYSILLVVLVILIFPLIPVLP